MDAPVKVAIASFAHIHAASYVHALAQRSDVEVLAADPDDAPDTDRGKRKHDLARKLGVTYADSYEDLLAWKPDAVIVTTENSRHRSVVELFASAGVHILCEKPLATSVADGEAMIAACQRSGSILMVAHPVRFSPAYRAARELVQSGAIGRVVTVQGTNTGKLPVERAWFVDPDLAGGGALVDHVVHCADLIDDLTNGEVAATVFAAGNRLLHPDLAVEVETAGIAAVTYPSGLTVTIDCSWSQPQTAPTWGGLTLRIRGDRGEIAIDPFSDAVGGFDERGAVHESAGIDIDAIMLDVFIDAVKASGPARPGLAPRVIPQPDGEAGLRSLRIIDAARTSAMTQRAVSLAR
jgi:predicted dehydrogenase